MSEVWHPWVIERGEPGRVEYLAANYGGGDFVWVADALGALHFHRYFDAAAVRDTVLGLGSDSRIERHRFGPCAMCATAT